MNRKHQIIHIVSFFALLMSVFGPVLNQPVLAQDTQATPVLETPVVLTPVVPVKPTISEATCSDGVVFAQTATPAQTEGIEYSIDEPDADGVFTVTATLSDPSLYTWAESGLDGWIVTGDVATSTGTVDLCSIPENDNAPEPKDGGSAPGEIAVSTPEPLEISTPSVGANTVGISAESGFIVQVGVVTMDGNIEPGTIITYPVYVTYYGEGSAEYMFYAFLPAGTSYYAAVGDSGNCGLQGNLVECTPGVPLSDSWMDRWYIQAKIDENFVTADTCNDGLEAIFAGISLDSAVTNPDPYITPLPDSLCQGLSLEASIGTVSTITEGEEFVYTIKVANTGYLASGSYAFSSQLPVGLELAGENPIISPIESSCTPEQSGGITTINCVGPDLPANAEPHLYIVSVRASTDLNPNICDTTHTIPVSGTAGVLIGQNQQTSTFTVTCAALLTFDIDVNPSTANTGDLVEFTVTIENIGTADSEFYDFSTELVAGIDNLEVNTPWIITQPDGTTCVTPQASEGYAILRCNNGFAQPASLAPSEKHEYKVSLAVKVTSCETLLSRGGGISDDELWASGSRYADGHFFEANLLTVNCDWNLSIGASSDPVAGTVLIPGDAVEFWINVQNTGTSPASDYSFHINSQDEELMNFGAYSYGGSSPELLGRACWKADDGSFDCWLQPSGTIVAGFSEFYKFRGTVKAASPELCQNGVEIILTPTGNTWANSAPITTHFPVDCSQLNLSITDKLVEENAIDFNEEFTYSINVTNTGFNEGGDFSFTTTLPPGIIPVTIADTRCSAEYQAEIYKITCEDSRVPVDPEGITFDIPVIAAGLDNEDFCALLSVTTQVDGVDGVWVAGQKTASASTDVQCFPNLTLDIEADKTVAQPGDIITYTITVANDGYGQEDHMLFHADIPAGTSMILDPPVTISSGLTCNSLDESTRKISCYRDGMPSDAEYSISYSVQVITAITSDVCQGLETVLTEFAGRWDEDNPASHNVPMQCPKLDLALTDNLEDDESIGLNEPFTYTFTVTNTGDSAIGEFSFTSTLPDGIILSGPLDPRCESATESGDRIVRCTDSSVPVDGITFDVNVIAVDTETTLACGTRMATASAENGVWSSTQTDVDELTEIACISSFAFSNQPVKSPVIPGESIGFELTIHNDGNTRITSLGIDDGALTDLPGNGEWTTTAKLNGTSINPGDVQELTAGETLVIRYVSSEIPPDLTLPETEWCTTWSSNFTISAEFTWGPEQEETESSAVQVNCTGLTIDQQVDAALIAPGGEVEYTITVTNIGTTAVSPMMVFHDASETGAVFSNWSVTSEGELDCGLVEDVNPGCTYLLLNPDESVEVIITGNAPEAPRWDQCGPVSSQAVFFYGEALAPTMRMSSLTPPYTPIKSEPVITRLDCQPGVEIEKSATVNTGENERVDAGDVVTYTINVANSGNITLYDVIVSDEMTGVAWDRDLSIASLEPGEVATFTGTYSVTQEDIDIGSLTNSASVEASLVEPASVARVTVFGFAQTPDDTQTVSDSVTNSLQLVQEPGVTLDVRSEPDTGDDDELNLGDSILYTFAITNTGNVTLTNLELPQVQDGLVFPHGTSIAVLAPGEMVELTATYEVTQADVEAGSIESCADLVGMAPDQSTVRGENVCVTNTVAQIPPPTSTPDPTATPSQTVTPVPTVTPSPTEIPATPPSPATPDASPTSPATPTATATETPAQGVTQLPTTGSGGVTSISAILWTAAVIGVLALGLGGMGVKRRPNL